MKVTNNPTWFVDNGIVCNTSRKKLAPLYPTNTPPLMQYTYLFTHNSPACMSPHARKISRSNIKQWRQNRSQQHPVHLFYVPPVTPRYIITGEPDTGTLKITDNNPKRGEGNPPMWRTDITSLMQTPVTTTAKR